VQQNAPLTQQTREAIADGAATLGTQAGAIGAVATSAAIALGPYGKTAEAVVATATVIAVSASTVEQLTRPDTDKAFVEAPAQLAEQYLEMTPAGRAASPITFALSEIWKASGTAKTFTDWINAQLKDGTTK
jgi:hypothetical protein